MIDIRERELNTCKDRCIYKNIFLSSIYIVIILWCFCCNVCSWPSTKVINYTTQPYNIPKRFITRPPKNTILVIFGIRIHVPSGNPGLDRHLRSPRPHLTRRRMQHTCKYWYKSLFKQSGIYVDTGKNPRWVERFSNNVDITFVHNCLNLNLLTYS
jgi:hypothetical protein